jgi:hypothetical protein
VNGEAALVGGLTHNLDRGPERVAGPVDEPAGEALVSEDMPDRAGQVGTEQSCLAAVTVLPRGRQDRDGDQQAGGVGDDEPLASVDLLAGVVAARVLAYGVGASAVSSDFLKGLSGELAGSAPILQWDCCGLTGSRKCSRDVGTDQAGGRGVVR